MGDGIMIGPLEKKILSLNSDGKSLRQIAAVLGISHVAVLKKLRAIEAKKQVVTSKGKQDLPLKAGEKDVASGFMPHPSRVCRKSEDGVNQVVTQPHSSPAKGESGNSSGNLISTHPGAVSSSIDDLFGAIREFLESQGIELYRMQVSVESYQVRHGQQTIRFYIDRKKFNSTGRFD